MAKVTPRTKAWKAFSEFIRVRDAIETTGDIQTCRCITCGKPKPVYGVGCIQAGHFVPGRCNAVLFDEEAVHGQCYGCNCGQGGMWVEYEKAMVEMFGEEKTEEMKQRKYQTVKYTAADYRDIELKYKQKTKDLKSGY